MRKLFEDIKIMTENNQIYDFAYQQGAEGKPRFRARLATDAEFGVEPVRLYIDAFDAGWADGLANYNALAGKGLKEDDMAGMKGAWFKWRVIFWDETYEDHTVPRTLRDPSLAWNAFKDMYGNKMKALEPVFEGKLNEDWAWTSEQLEYELWNILGPTGGKFPPGIVSDTQLLRQAFARIGKTDVNPTEMAMAQGILAKIMLELLG